MTGAVIGQLGVSYSLEEFIETRAGFDVKIHYDGIELPVGENYVYLKPMTTPIRTLSKGRETVLSEHTVNVHIKAQSLADRSVMESTLTELFMFEEMPIYNSYGDYTGVKTPVEVVNIIPLYPEEISEESHRNELIITVEVILGNNKYGRNGT